MAAPMGDIFVTGLIVPDIEKAVAETTATLGIEFTPVQESPLKMRTPNGIEEFDLRFVYSLGGAPHVELIQAVAGTYYDPRGNGYMRHIGMWVDDLAVASAELASRGLPLEAAGMNGDEEPYAFVFHANDWGLRVELVDRVQQDYFETWLGGGELQI
jgi:hypothetical protein